MTRRRPGVGGCLAVGFAVALVAGLGRPVPATLALIVDSEAVPPATFSTEQLDAPTNLNATASFGLVVTLTWTISPDARATGYQVLRGTSSSGPFAQVGTATPRTATSYVDAPLVPGTYWYVLRTYYGAWTSPNSNLDSVFAL